MNELREAIEEYVALRQALGYSVQKTASGLRSFAAFAESENRSHVTVDLAFRWAKLPPAKEPSSWASRLQMVRGFARWHNAIDPRTEVPLKDLLPGRYRRKRPYIYSDKEIEDLLLAARDLPSPRGLRGLTYWTLFGLLAVSGMRLREAVTLDRGDVDLEEGVLTIRRTKFRKSRLVPLHESTRDVLANYDQERDRILARAANIAFFVSEGGVRITTWAACYTFARVSREIGLRPPTERCRHGRGPRIHDMRHRFATRTLLEWYRRGVDVEREMPKLSTYLGHVHVNDTYWYLEAVPELLELATRRLVNAEKETDA